MKKTILVLSLSFALACSHANAPVNAPAGKVFDTPQAAATALADAVAVYDVPQMLVVLGPDAEDLVASEDHAGDRVRAKEFTERYRQRHSILVDPEDRTRATLLVGNQDWPLPIPIVERNGKWHFDTREGRDELLRRRIGANELDAITVCRGYVEAQHQYAERIHDDSGVPQFAQKLVSTPGKQDGLAWQYADGTWGGPIGAAIAKEIQAGYAERGEPFHGYYFKVLKGQGPSATLGKLDYVIEGNMIGGFALLAWPAEYRVTGVKTFMVSWDGVVFQKDLGANTASVARGIDRFDPDDTWKPTDDDW